MLHILIFIILSMFFLPDAYGIKDKKDLMEDVLKELKKNEIFSSKQAADPEIIKKIQDKNEYEKIKDSIKSDLKLSLDDLIANPKQLTRLFYNFFNLFFNLKFLPFSVEIHFGSKDEETVLFNEFCNLHDALCKKGLDCDKLLWAKGGLDELDMKSVQENLVVALSLLSLTIGKYSDTKYEFLHIFKLSLSTVLGYISESFPCFKKWGDVLVTDNKFFKDPRYVFKSGNKEFLAKEFDKEYHKFVIDAAYVDIAAEAKQAKELKERELSGKQIGQEKKQKLFDELKKIIDAQDTTDLVGLYKAYIEILCDPYFIFYYEIKGKQGIDKIMISFDKLIDSAKGQEKKEQDLVFQILKDDDTVLDVLDVAGYFLREEESKPKILKGITKFKNRLNKIKDLIFKASGTKFFGTTVTQELKNFSFKQSLGKLKKSLKELRIKLEELRDRLKDIKLKIEKGSL